MTASTQFWDFICDGIPQKWTPQRPLPLDPPEDINLDHYAYGQLAEREIRDALNRYSEPDFLDDIDWNLDDVELCPQGNYVIAQLFVRVKIPFGSLYK